VRRIDGELCYVGRERWELLCGAAGSCAEGQEGEVAWSICELLEEGSKSSATYQ